MATTAQAFSSFLKDTLEPTDWHRNTHIPARKQRVAENLTEAFPSDCDMPYSRCELFGSAAKDTIIRPLDDIDVLAIFSDKGAYSRYRYNSAAFLYRIRNAYDGLEIQQVGSRGQAVRVFFETGGHVDVAPVFWEGDDDYLLPAGDGTWIRTSPFKANAWFRKKNEDLSYNLRPMVRLLKSWNRSHSKRFRSYHMETVAAETFSSLGSNYRTGLRGFFEWAPNHLDVLDPGGHGGLLSGYLTWSSRRALRDSLDSSAERAIRAIEAEEKGDHAEAKRLWAILLGDDFPTS